MKYVCDTCGLEFKDESECLEHERYHRNSTLVGDYVIVKPFNCKVCQIKEVLQSINHMRPPRLRCEEVVGRNKEKLLLEKTDVKRATVWDFVKTLDSEEAANFFAILISPHPEMVKDKIKDELNELLTDKKFGEVLTMKSFILSCFC